MFQGYKLASPIAKQHRNHVQGGVNTHNQHADIRIMRLRSAIHLFILSAAILLPSCGHAETAISELQEQRQLFQSARDAIKSNQRNHYKRIAKQLTNYPLYSYLEYWDINRHLSSTKASRVRDFITLYKDQPLANRLKSRWLTHLAKRNRWTTFLEFYTPSSNTEMQCYYRRALYKTGKKEKALEGLETIWLRGRSQPKACDPLFVVWNEAGKLTTDLAWKRVELAMDNNQSYLARYLERFLDEPRSKQTQLWRQAHRRPAKHLSDPRLKKDTPINRTILAHSVRRMTRRNASAAATAWNKLVMNYEFSEEQFNKTESHIAVALARQNAPEAMHWLTNLADDENPEVRKWRILTTINREEWDKTLHWLDQLPEKELQTNNWQYWRARALQEEGKEERAKLVYSALAQKRSYYGFLAADKLELPYKFEDHPLRFSNKDMQKLQQIPEALRAREFYAIGDILNARREWYALTQKLPYEELPKAAQLAHEWGWHDRAIFTLGKANYWDDLEIRFPLAHKDQVVSVSNNQKIDPSWSYAVIRQESAFASDARSPKGAMGLMQIMPNTGRNIAKDLRTKLKNKHQLLDADTNIRFGVNYLRKVFNRFDQNTVLATAAYNAGSQRVKSWLPEEQELAPDVWIENVPFKETRNYLKQVLAYTTIYDKRLTKPVTPLKKRMPTINPK